MNRNELIELAENLAGMNIVVRGLRMMNVPTSTSDAVKLSARLVVAESERSEAQRVYDAGVKEWVQAGMPE